MLFVFVKWQTLTVYYDNFNCRHWTGKLRIESAGGKRSF